MEAFDITRLESVAVKLEGDWPVIDEKIKANSDDQGNIPILKRLKFEACSDDESVTEQMLHNSQVLSNSEYINVYDDMLDIDNVKPEISALYNIGGDTAGESNNKSNQASSCEDTLCSKGLKLEHPFSCELCNFKCNSSSKLNEHLLTHPGEKPFLCNNCDYKSTKKQLLRLHSLTHTSDKRFECDICEFKCKRKRHLDQHFLTHTGAKPFSCDRCDYKSRHRGHLKRHLLTHTSKKPFSCDICGYKCSEKGQIKRHLMNHSGERPISCTKCDYRCKRRSNLSQHLLTHTDEKPFSCNKCDKQFTRKSDVKRHLLSRCPFSKNKIKSKRYSHGIVTYNLS